MTLLNAMTVDLEDWAQSVLDPALPVSSRVIDNTRRVLDLLDRTGTRATFFALGKVCERYPELLPLIAAAGHEIGSHGYGHELVYRLSPSAFDADIRRSADLIEQQTGRRPTSYRAPAFSITAATPWAGAILAEAGFRVSSSIFPFAGRRYGMPDRPDRPHRWPDGSLIEFPLTTVRLLGHRFPACGGGYTRLLPGGLLAQVIRRLNRADTPAVIYLHPYELAPGEVHAFHRTGTPVPWSRRLTQELFRSRVAPRIERLLRAFPFSTLSESLATAPLAHSVPNAAPGSLNATPALA